MMCGVLMGNAFISRYRPQTRKHALPAACCSFTLLTSGLGGWGAGEKRFSGGGNGNRGLTKLPHHREGNIQPRVHDALLAALAGATARKDEARARPAGPASVAGPVSPRCCGAGWRKDEGAPAGTCPAASKTKTAGRPWPSPAKSPCFLACFLGWVQQT